MSDSQAGQSIGGIFVGTLGIILGTVCIVGFAVSYLVIDYIEGEMEENCEGTIKEIIIDVTDADEGKCQDGKDWRGRIVSLQMPLLILGITFVSLGIWTTYQN